MSAEAFTTKRGDTSTIRRMRLEGIAVGASTCTQSVIDAEGQVVLGPRAVSDTVTVDGEEWFRVYLEPADTAPLAKGTYTWAVQLSSTAGTPQVTKEIHRTLFISEQLIP